MSCDEIEELLPEYVLGALSRSETVEVVRHLCNCLTHTTSLDKYEAVCLALCASVPIVNPPAHLKARLLASVTDQRV